MPPASSRQAWIRGIAAYAALLALAAAGGAFLLAGDGSGRWMDTLSFLQRPFAELESAYRGGADAADGAEYVVFTGSGGVPPLRKYLEGHAAVRYVSAGLLPGVSVVRIRGDVKPALAELNRQPYVEMVLKARVGMVCH
jgi:hypothetical protein